MTCGSIYHRDETKKTSGVSESEAAIYSLDNIESHSSLPISDGLTCKSQLLVGDLKYMYVCGFRIQALGVMEAIVGQDSENDLRFRTCFINYKIYL